MQIRSTDDKTVLNDNEGWPTIRPPEINDYKAVTTTKEGIKIVSEDDIQQTFLYASKTLRHRHPILLHSDFKEAPQRFINCLDHGSYVRFHMYTLPH